MKKAAAIIGTGVALALGGLAASRLPSEPSTCNTRSPDGRNTPIALGNLPLEECVKAIAKERGATGYNPHTGDIFSVADGGHD